MLKPEIVCKAGTDSYSVKRKPQHGNTLKQANGLWHSNQPFYFRLVLEFFATALKKVCAHLCLKINNEKKKNVQTRSPTSKRQAQANFFCDQTHSHAGTQTYPGLLPPFQHLLMLCERTSPLAQVPGRNALLICQTTTAFRDPTPIHCLLLLKCQKAQSTRTTQPSSHRVRVPPTVRRMSTSDASLPVSAWATQP